MAQIQTETIKIQVNRLVKDGMQSPDQITDEVLATLEQVAQELINNDAVVVEVVRGE